MSLAAQRSRQSSLTIVATALLSAILVFAVAAVSVPGDALGASSTKVAKCSANLRSTASTKARVLKLITTGTKVVANAKVTGGSWRTTCTGKAVSGNTWFRIYSVNGRTIKSMFGVTYVYGASGLFKAYVPPAFTKYAACRANLRTAPKSSATAKTILLTDTKALVAAKVTGTSYSTICSGKAVSGSGWYRIIAVNGKTVQSLYGVSSLYAASALFKSTPTSTPTLTLAPTPTPTPVPSAGIAVPSSIDATGASDASAALNTWLGTVPSGSAIQFKAGGIYRMNQGLKVSKTNLTFEGNGATLKSNGDYQDFSSLFIVSGTGIVIRNFNLVGNSPTPGVYRGSQEWAHGILTIGGGHIEIANVKVSAVYGDCIKVGKGSDTVWFHDSTCTSVGRNGVSIIAGSNVTVERVAFPKSGYCTFDIEPNTTTEGAYNIKFLNNTAGTWTNSFLSADGAAGSVVNGVTVSGNTITGKSLKTIIDLARRQNVVFTNNSSLVAAGGPVLQFAHIDGLTVTGNVQPLTSGVLASITDSTNVTYH